MALGRHDRSVSMKSTDPARRDARITERVLDDKLFEAFQVLSTSLFQCSYSARRKR
ncbi:hypothetical protein MPLDJ20_20150 [Mesorhizobium plurifarium]|uniref:Uncharacterized protein n=1 Tax=Mesorhizobium plurifarium TaxID=69974 RepID=A0A090EV67_MESPL|nr:hypothetical protein MPLSOD_150032 [Mesorhizobium sp. SOD10]CDX35356.1 hypothetical protein MPLDJ20_20150 [Mesorhizobium plurifarium]